MHERGMAVPVIIGVIIVAAVGLYLLMAGRQSEAPTLEEEMVDEAMVDEEMDQEADMTGEGEEMSEGEPIDAEGEGEADAADDVEGELEVLGEQAGTYQEYQVDLLDNASDGDVVLFFHAAWCPTCRATDDDIAAREGEIPSDLTILKVDYDSSSDLIQKYGVTTQHTFVQVDSEGNEINQWSGSATLDDIVENLQ